MPDDHPASPSRDPVPTSPGYALSAADPRDASAGSFSGRRRAPPDRAPPFPASSGWRHPETAAEGVGPQRGRRPATRDPRDGRGRAGRAGAGPGVSPIARGDAGRRCPRKVSWARPEVTLLRPTGGLGIGTMGDPSPSGTPSLADAHPFLRPPQSPIGRGPTSSESASNEVRMRRRHSFTRSGRLRAAPAASTSMMAMKTRREAEGL